MIEYTRDEVLDKLIAAGLGDIEQQHITSKQYERAMRGEVVIKQKTHGPATKLGLCPRCGALKENRAWSYCRKCNSEKRVVRTFARRRL